jgi:hypothetical protein
MLLSRSHQPKRSRHQARAEDVTYSSSSLVRYRRSDRSIAVRLRESSAPTPELERHTIILSTRDTTVDLGDSLVLFARDSATSAVLRPGDIIVRPRDTFRVCTIGGSQR